MVEEDGEEWVLVRRPSEAEIVTALCAGEDGAEEARPLKVVFSEPAVHWTDATPIGNGSLGGMIWGGVPTESIQLNHDTLWTGIPGNYTNSEAPSILSKVRQLVDSGNYAEATAAAFGLSGHSPDAYQPLGEINLEFDKSHSTFTSYERELDLDTAMAKVKYTLGDIEYTREHYSSHPHQVIVTKISASKPASLSFTVFLDSKLHHHSHVNGASQIIMEGSCPGKKKKSPKEIPPENPSGIRFTAILDLQISDDAGHIQVQDDRKLRVEDSNWAVLLLVANSSFSGPFTDPSDSRKDPTASCVSTVNSVKKFSYSQLYSHHLNDYQELFHRVTLQLSKSSKSEVENNRLVLLRDDSENNVLFTSKHHATNRRITPGTNSSNEFAHNALISTAERVKSFRLDEDPTLVELLFQYGRYLLISCSRPGTQVANLQGIWSKDVEPPWDAAPHLNINLQMNYWPSLPCNLIECQEPLFDYINSLAINGSKTAKVNYDCSGWVAHQVSDLWAKTSPDAGDPVWALWPMGGAWLCTHLWEHYTFSMDKAFLEKKAYPYLEGCASFLLDWLIEGHGGYLETNPSTSPEHYFIAPDGKAACVSYSSTMDIAITKEIFTTILSASEILGRTEDALVEKVRKALPKLPPTRISRDGSVMEWAQDFEDAEVHHRHVSHLFGLFPGHTITAEKNPDLCRAVEYSLFKRGDVGPGWSTTWKMALWAHLHNSEHAYKMIKQLINLVDPDHESDFEGGLYTNLFTAHPPFQIDANFGFTSGLAEMLSQSTERDLYLLPALPRDKWAKGCVKGLKARGGVTVNICWKEGELHEAHLWSKSQNQVKRLHYRGTVTTVALASGTIYTFDRYLKCLKSQPFPDDAV